MIPRSEYLYNSSGRGGGGGGGGGGGERSAAKLVPHCLTDAKERWPLHPVVLDVMGHL